MKSDPIHVTRPDLPPLDDFVACIEEIWASKILTNGGPFHERLEEALCDHLGVKHIALFANGTMALMVALRALELSGEVITTPFSFVATANALRWNGLTPVFVDIDPVTLNLDAAKIEAAISPETTAIMPVHCYGMPCDIQAIKSLASDHGIHVIYDAAHAFGVRDEGGSILRHGDLSVLSFHATKVFNTFEGGAVICPDAETKRRVDLLKNFGIVDELNVETTGINGKMNELSAALGLLQLDHVDGAIRHRQHIDETYRRLFDGLPGIRCIEKNQQVVANYSYFPILVEDNFSLSRDALYEKLGNASIFSRRYFFPLISQFPMYRDLRSASRENLIVASQTAERVLCLPIHSTLTDADCNRIFELIAEA